MAVLAYNLSDNLQAYLKKVDELRKELALMPIPPRDERRLRWEASVERVYWALLLSNSDISKNHIQKFMSSSKKKLSPLERLVSNHKKAFNYIKQEWQATTKPINFNAFTRLQSILTKYTGQGRLITSSRKRTFERLISYLESSKEHPILKAGLAQIQTNEVFPIEEDNLITPVIPYLFLYKDGYDFRELLVIEEFFRRDLMTFRNARSTATKNDNSTLWLEYFTYAVFTQVKKAIKTAENRKFSTEVPAKIFKLNERQKGILSSLEEPGSKISNKEVRKEYKVSQITASRDLSQLEDLGLLFKHGDGRSTYYTKV